MRLSAPHDSKTDACSNRLKHRLARRHDTRRLHAAGNWSRRSAALVPPPRFHLVATTASWAVRERARSHRAGGEGVRPIQSSSSPESASTLSRVDGDPASAAPAETRGLRLDRDARFDAPRRLARDSVAIAVASAGASAGPDVSRVRRLAWAELMNASSRSTCSSVRAARPMRILATIHPPETTSAILACLGLPVARPTARAGASRRRLRRRSGRPNARRLRTPDPFAWHRGPRRPRASTDRSSHTPTHAPDRARRTPRRGDDSRAARRSQRAALRRRRPLLPQPWLLRAQPGVVIEPVMPIAWAPLSDRI